MIAPSALWYNFLEQAKKDGNTFYIVMERDVNYPASMGSFERALYEGDYDKAAERADGKNRDTLYKVWDNEIIEDEEARTENIRRA